MVQLFEHAAAAEPRQIAADYRHVLGGGQLHGGGRRRHDDGAVLEELGNVEHDAGYHQGGDDTPSAAGRAEHLGLERMTDHDVAVDGERERQPDRTHLQCERRRVEVRKDVRVEITVVAWRPACRLRLGSSCVLPQTTMKTIRYVIAAISSPSSLCAVIQRHVWFIPLTDERGVCR